MPGKNILDNENPAPSKK